MSGSGLFAVFLLSFGSSRVYSRTGTDTLIVHLLAEANKASDISLRNVFCTEICLFRYLTAVF